MPHGLAGCRTSPAVALRSLRQVCDENGVDLDDVLTDNAELLRRYEELGLPVPVWLQRVTPGAKPEAAAAVDAPDGNADDSNDSGKAAA